MEGEPAGEGAGVAGTALLAIVWFSPDLAAGLAELRSLPALIRSAPALAKALPTLLGTTCCGCVLNATLPRPVRTAGSACLVDRIVAAGLASSACKPQPFE